MKKTITIGNQPVELSSSAGWLYVYRAQFGRDILPDIMPIIESALEITMSVLGEIKDDEISLKNITEAMDQDLVTSIVINLAGLESITLLNIIWAMAKKADGTIERPEEFFDRFETFPLDEVVPEIFGMIVESSISSKNAKRLLEGLNKLREKTGSHSTGSPSQEPKEGLQLMH